MRKVKGQGASNSKMSTMKVIFVTPEKQLVIYAQNLAGLPDVENFVQQHLREIFGPQQEIRRANFRKYWIDDEGDTVEILNSVDFDFFLKRTAGGCKTPKIYFEADAKLAGVVREQPSRYSLQASQHNHPLAVHETITCDACMKSPIVGFRYKCLECNNYDLCMHCESKMAHKDHLMLRIPTYGSSMIGKRYPKKSSSTGPLVKSVSFQNLTLSDDAKK